MPTTETLHLGIDLGGTKIEIIALDGDGEVRLRRRIPTPQGDYRATIEAIAGLVESAEAELGRRGTLGVGTPGAVSPASGLIKNANSTCLIGHPLDRDLSERLGRPVRVANDANCFALSEATDGAGAGAAVVFGVIIGTGTGAGIVVHGRVLTGPNAIAGEWGHNPLPWPGADELPGPDCYCGRRGCMETWVSGPGLVRDHQRTSGQRLESQEIVARALAGDSYCAASLERYADRLARGLAHVINILDPDVIVLGGGMSNITALYERVPLRWTEWVFSDTVRTRLLPPVHGDSSGVRGAAWLGKEAVS
ncbi:MAG: ROK family protein [Gammaproteobacteria bacterium]|nr:MAG: ROK family protein [Gammaproteobacteria bacterium]